MVVKLWFNTFTVAQLLAFQWPKSARLPNHFACSGLFSSSWAKGVSSVPTMFFSSGKVREQEKAEEKHVLSVESRCRSLVESRKSGTLTTG
jgi:hypothetical protein